MKILILIAALLVSGLNLQAQTFTPVPTNALAVSAPALPSIPQEIWDAVANPTNIAVAFGGGADTSFKRKVVFGDLLYSLTDHAGLIFGYDYMTGGSKSELNVLRGGLNIKTDIQIFKTFGYTNVVLTPWIADMISTGTSGSVGNVLATGGNIRVYAWSKIDLSVGGFYEKRSGQGEYDGGYPCIEAALRGKF